MAGNTKLIGFNPGGYITLRRWGESVNVQVSEESMSSIRYACTEDLPSRDNFRSNSEEFSTEYDEQTGTIKVSLNAVSASKIVDGLTVWAESGADGAGRAKAWADDLRDRLRDHLEFINVEDEPGVQNTP
jgi:hypothetical protein